MKIYYFSSVLQNDLLPALSNQYIMLSVLCIKFNLITIYCDVINITIYVMLFIVIYSEQFYIVHKKCVNFVPTKIEIKRIK